MVLWNVFRYELKDGKPLKETRTALLVPMPDRKGFKYLADQGNKLAAEEGSNFLFRVEKA